MANNYFITGTDTDVGKTLVTVALLKKAQQYGLRCLGLKPIAAGARLINGRLRNDDALRLQAASNIAMPYSQINPVVFEEAIAPHIAAEKTGRSVTIKQLEGFVRGALMSPADVRFVEGAGGWMMPVNRREPLSLLPQRLKLDVIIVVGMKLGCINHAMLTVAAIKRDGLTIAGWIANNIDPRMAELEANIHTLETIVDAPCLGKIPYIENPYEARIERFIELPEALMVK